MITRRAVTAGLATTLIGPAAAGHDRRPRPAPRTVLTATARADRSCAPMRRATRMCGASTVPSPRRAGQARARNCGSCSANETASAPVASLPRRARPERHGRRRRADPGAGGHRAKPRVPLHPARCRHLPDPALRPRRQRGAAGARALGPADRRGAEPAPGRPRPRSADRRLAPERRRFARRRSRSRRRRLPPAASEAGSASTARRRRSGSRRRPADACACGSPMPAMRAPCACASTG